MSVAVSVEPMSDSNHEFESRPVSRRAVLATVGTAAATGLAGCGGNGGDGDGGDNTDAGGDGQPSGTNSDGTGSGGDDGTESGDGDDTDSGGGDNSQSGGGNCPSVPSSYAREDVPAMLSDDPVATIGVPESGASINPGSRVLRVEYSRGSINVQSRDNPNTTVEAELSSDLTEVTAEYDLPSGARAQRTDIPGGNRVDVYIPADSDVVYVSVAAAGLEECLDGSLTTIRDEMVNSIQLA